MSCRRRQRCEVGVDLGREGCDVLGMLALRPVEQAAGDLLKRRALRARGDREDVGDGKVLVAASPAQRLDA